MELLRIPIQPRTPFGGTMRGDTLFGQLCWAIRNRFGEARLNDLLADYRHQPFVVCSDALPLGFLPRPALPQHRFERVGVEDRKAVKKRRWLPLAHLGSPVRQWLQHCMTDREVADMLGVKDLGLERPQPRNSIHRLLGSTHGSDFAPYSSPQRWFGSGLKFDLWVLHNPQRISADELVICLTDIGSTGYGRDATIGLGKFTLEEPESEAIARAEQNSDTYLTLAPCAPQGIGCDPRRSFYQPFTRFGRHGDRAVFKGNPFKSPVLLADTGALLRLPGRAALTFVGQGLGGDGSLSKSMPQTVHQGYAPAFGVNMEGIV